MPGLKKKILVVEDNLDQRIMLKVALERNGYVVAEASGAQQALLCAEMSEPELILLDLSLASNVDGWEVLRRLKTYGKTASIPVMIVSAVVDQTCISQARANGADDYLTKPYGIPELLRRVERLLGASVGNDPVGNGAG